MNEKDLIIAIRNNPLIGRGTCSSIDECLEDAELWKRFGPPAGNLTIREAINAAIESEDLFIEQHVEHRFGDDDDVELKIAAEWEERKLEVGY